MDNHTIDIINYSTDNFMNYCNSTLNKILILGSLVLILWLIQPMITKLINKSNIIDGFFISKSTLIYMYKWLGLGLFFMVLLLMTFIRKCFVCV